LIDSPIEGVIYKCNEITAQTQSDGSFNCSTYPINFYIGDIKLGSINYINQSGYVTPQDLAGVSLDTYNENVTKIAQLLQSLDDDGDIEDTIKINQQLVDKLNKLYDKEIDISTLSLNDIELLLEEIDAPEIVTTTEAITHLQTHIEALNITDEPNSQDIDSSLKNIYLNAINEARVEGRSCGEYGYMPAVEPLSWNENLYKASLEHSRDMALSNTFSHTGSGTTTDITAQVKKLDTGSSMVDRAEYNGYTSWKAIGENIAAGTNMDTAKEAMEAWLKSDGHCHNIMSPNYTEVGLALYHSADSSYKYYWTQDFGAR